MAVETTRATAFQTAQRRFDAAADVIGLSDDARRGLRDIKRELTVHFPVHMDDAGRPRVGSVTTPTSLSTSSRPWRC
jgi:peroxiredoxin